LVYDASSKTWLDSDSLSLEQRVEGYTTLLDESRELMTKEASKAAKAEKKLNVTLGGYQARSSALSKRITDAFEELQKNKRDYDSFSRLHVNEVAVGPRRVAALKEEVEKLENREKLLQERYAELEFERRESQSRVTALEEKVMAEAEALNEASLAEMDGIEQ
jgi:pre-mRNA-splicing factor CDC5/CEF1